MVSNYQAAGDFLYCGQDREATMTGLSRTLAFLKNETVDRPPFHPIIMRWAAKYADVKYREFCLDYRKKCDAMIRCASDFDADWVAVISDPWVEASAFGVQIEYPEDDLPKDVSGHLSDLKAAAKLKPFRTSEHMRTVNRVNEIREFKRRIGDQYFIVGWVEGPVAEYADLRGVTLAAMDFLDDPDSVSKAMDVITSCAIDFITQQVDAGAHCIGIGDAFCSQIGPNLYRRLAFEREKRIVDHVHHLGAIAKLHICGNTSAILPDMIQTGADIIDVDHLVLTMSKVAGLLAPTQVFSGKTDPVSVIQDGTEAQIEQSVRDSNAQARGRCIVSAGCEITPGTPLEKMRVFRRTADHLQSSNQKFRQ
jgi:MtaA/CmuA family methyltransferase